MGRKSVAFGTSGLRARFVMLIVTMIVGIVAILTAYFISTQKNLLHTELRSRAVSLAKNFAYYCEYPLILEDVPEIRKIAAGIMGEEDVFFIKVRTAGGKVLLEQARGAGPGDLHQRFQQSPEITRTQVMEGGDFLAVRMPVFKPSDEDLSLLESPQETAGAKIIGDALVCFSLQKTKQSVLSSIRSTLLITAAIAAAGILLAFAVIRHLMTPLISLTQGTREIASGNLGYRVAVYRDDELGTLARSFNEMAEELEAGKSAIEEYSRDLENKVRERTRELVQREEELSSILENNPAGIVLVNSESGLVSWVNPNALKIFDGSREEIEGHPYRNCLPESDRGGACVPFPDAPLGTTSECSLRTLKGKEVPVLKSLSKISYKGSEHLLYAFFDITEHKGLEAQLRQVQKMGAIGTLAGGIAHDFNNLLQGISGYAELVLFEEPISDYTRHCMHQVDHAVRRGADLIKQILTFSRKVESQLKPLDLNQEIKKLSELLARTLPKMIRIELQLHSRQFINGDSVQLEQMMMNLAVNARDAMPEGGRLIFRTEDVEHDENRCKVVGVSPSRHCVLLSVSDTGAGMEQATIDRVFEPFFTTKEMGKGTGLGLAMVYGMVKSHAGSIQCLSHPGRGTTFQIFFPALEAVPLDAAAEERTDWSRLPAGTETVLLVDDEQTVLMIAQTVLRRQGYTVLVAENGESAVELFKSRTNPVDLVVLDLGMPGMGGEQCLRELLRIDPEVKVIVASGYTSSKSRQDLLAAGARAFIDKPYQVRALLSAVREVLDRGRKAPIPAP